MHVYQTGFGEALAGQCTETAGYLTDTKIKAVVADNPSALVYCGEDAFSNNHVYNTTEWVSYMNGTNKAVRILLSKCIGSWAMLTGR